MERCEQRENQVAKEFDIPMITGDYGRRGK